MTNTLNKTPEINREHPRIKNRTPDQQQYRDDLAKVLIANRQLGEIGRDAAKLVLEAEKRKTKEISRKHEDIYDENQARLIIEQGEGHIVAEYLESFAGLDHQKITELLIEERDGDPLAYNLDKFHKLDHQKLINLLVERQEAYYNTYGNNEHRYDNVDYSRNNDYYQIKITEEYDAVIKNLEKFQGIDENQISELLINQGQIGIILKNLEKFKGLNEKAKQALINHGYEKEVNDHPEVFI